MTQIPPERLETLYAWLVDCAETGLPCPRNSEICERFGLASISSAAKLIARLEGAGRIAVERTRSTRRVTITASGARTIEMRPGGPVARRTILRRQPKVIPFVPPPPPPPRKGEKGRQCQWIDAEPTGDDSCKCLVETLRGKQWCADHYPRVWRPAEKKEA